MEKKKTVSIVVPIYNEVLMVEEIYSRVSSVFEKLDNYEFEIVFFDDGSTDGTADAVKELSHNHKEVKGVFYARNFGYLKSTFYCMQQAKGDCAVILHADLQNPPELIPQFIEKWENGAQVVLGVKNKSHENKFMYFLRSVFYFLMNTVFGVKITPHATEFELFDKSFISVLNNIKTNNPFLRGIIGDYATKTECIYYTQNARKKGKTKFNLSKYYEFAMCGITHYSKKLARKIIGFSFLGIIACIIEFLFNFIPQWSVLHFFELSNLLITRAVILMLFVLFILISILYEYLSSVMNELSVKPLIVEKERINY